MKNLVHFMVMKLQQMRSPGAEYSVIRKVMVIIPRDLNCGDSGEFH